jgi:hypothetical protein
VLRCSKKVRKSLFFSSHSNKKIEKEMLFFLTLQLSYILSVYIFIELLLIGGKCFIKKKKNVNVMSPQFLFFFLFLSSMCKFSFIFTFISITHSPFLPFIPLLSLVLILTDHKNNSYDIFFISSVCVCRFHKFL